MLGSIGGFITFPISILLFLNVFGVTDVQRIFGIPVLLIAAIALIVLQVLNILDSHTEGHSFAITYGVHALMALPSFVYFISLLAALPAAVTGALPLIFACFIFVEGIWSLFMFA